MNKTVFISYSGEDSGLASMLDNYLRREGVTTIWIDKNEIFAGDDISHSLKNAVQNSVCCIFILTANSQLSQWCMAEVGAFWGADKKVIVYRIDPQCRIPDHLTRIKVARTWEEVAEACRNIQEQPFAVAPPFSETFHKSGLTKAFRIPIDDHSRDLRIKEIIGEEREIGRDEAFRLVASSGNNYLSINGQSWRAGLGDAIHDDGAKFSVILESPFSSFAKTRALANRVSHHHWAEKVSIQRLKDLNSLDNITINVTEHAVNCSLFFTSRSVFYDPYLWARAKQAGRTENNFWVFEFSKIDDPQYDCYGLLLKHFDFLDSTSISLDEFLGENESRYTALTAKFKQEMEEELERFQRDA